MVKIKDVAEAAGVSTATVSRVLSNKPHVREEVKKRVMAVVKKLNYQPNRVAQSLRSNTSRIIALIVADIENPFFQRVSRAVDDAAQELGYNVILCNTDEDPIKEKKCLDLLRVENVAGIILSPTRKGIDNFTETYSLEKPIVMIDRHVSNFDVDNVLIDNVSSAYAIVSHLIEHGYKRIAGVFGAESTTGQERRQGFLKALKDNDIKPSQDLIKYSTPRENDGFNTALSLLQRNDRPDAIFTSNSLLASGTIRAIRESKLSIPNDIAIASFDDTSWAQLIDPALTVIEQPTYEIGRTAAELLIKRINDPSRSNREVVLKTKLVIRQSCGCSN
ncbi:LacI family DNA-binding transcriptional regulator [Desulfogranum marinum]|jgi:LacI family fructose operon transcriptional repressor|uniref:LacI family DNA-binding transcriptional regulator n=1 Tax=Desulfogranum marinum TaxID=453220 RepID=UPI0019629ABA|nr:LacI family DNA-binding transcriptional regulator [Desulfogranum marinum]MBM9514903.1 LacI family DNA-binding transcriptional regulator [Desulfogranum marinum]